MGSVGYKNKFKINVLFIMVALCLIIPSLAWSAGYQEQKLFDGNFYSSEDLRSRIENHTREIQVIKNQIKALETDIDWMVLKINQIQDTGRTADIKLKKTITRKEKKITTLKKTKHRLEYLVKYYSATLGSKKEQNLEDILRKKILSPEIKKKPVVKKEARIKVEDISTKTKVSLSKTATLPDNYTSSNTKLSKTDLQRAIHQSGLNDWVEIVGTGTCLRLETTLPILFATGSAKVASEYTSFFKKLARFLKPYDVKILVNGYADTVPIQNKKFPSNFELGAARAANIVHKLVKNGLKPSVFRIESTGKYRFAAKAMSKQKTLERRAEVTVIFSG